MLNIGNRPLIVYLDSQDFSRLSRPPKGKEEFYGNLLERLNALVAAARIEIRYSVVHVSEISHTEDAALPYSAGRAAVLSELSAGKCMRNWADIFEAEVRNHLDPSHAIEATRDGNRWLEVDLSTLGNFAETMKNQTNDSLKAKGYNRETRRKIGRTNFAKMLTETEDGRAALREIVDGLNSRYPLEEGLDYETLAGFVTGTIKKQHFLEHMRRLLVDPVTLITRLSPELDVERKLPSLVRNLGENLRNSLNPSLEKVAAHIADMPRGGVFDGLRKDLFAVPEKITRNVRLKQIRDAISTVDTGGKSQTRDYSESELDAVATPSLSCMMDALRKFISDMIASADAGKGIRKLQKSDAGDLFHAIYIPYVDIFRCDTGWVDALRVTGHKFDTEVVGRIEDLLPAIESRM